MILRNVQIKARPGHGLQLDALCAKGVVVLRHILFEQIPFRAQTNYLVSQFKECKLKVAKVLSPKLMSSVLASINRIGTLHDSPASEMAWSSATMQRDVEFLLTGRARPEESSNTKGNSSIGARYGHK